MLFKIGDRVLYNGPDVETTRLGPGMDGEVVRVFPESIEVYYFDLKKIIHHKDFDRRMNLKKLPRR